MKTVQKNRNSVKCCRNETKKSGAHLHTKGRKSAKFQENLMNDVGRVADTSFVSKYSQSEKVEILSKKGETKIQNQVHISKAEKNNLQTSK